MKVVCGDVLAIECERALAGWRETNLSAGDGYTIDLVDSEDGAMFETNTTEPFNVSLSNWTPQEIDGPRRSIRGAAQLNVRIVPPPRARDDENRALDQAPSRGIATDIR